MKVDPTRHELIRPDGTRLVYAAYGPVDAAGTVLFVHGLAAAGRQFMADARHFSAHGLRVLVPDLRGHGESGMAVDRDDPEGFSVLTLAGDLVAVLDDAGAAHVHWVGNSLGGIVGLYLLPQIPERLASFAMFGTAPRLALPALVPAMIPLLFRLLGRSLTAELTARQTTRDPEARKLIASILRAFDPEVGAAVARHVRSYDLSANVLAHTGPMLIMRCGRDHAVNRALTPYLERLAARPNIRIVALPEGGHCANLDATAAFRTALTEFWQTLPSG